MDKLEDASAIEVFIVISIIILFSGTFLLLMFKLIRFMFEVFVISYFDKNPYRTQIKNPKKLSSSERKILEDIVVFYQNLPFKSKEYFESRVANFIENKKFEGRGGIEITPEMKVLIAAGAIKVTFGIKDYLYEHFHTIIIYPKAYYSKITKQYHAGEVNPRGVVVFSWEDVLKGYANPYDNLNLVIHEFAHALYLCFKSSRLKDLRLNIHYPEWKKEKEIKFFKMRNSDESYLRRYAATNLMEFFAVVVEHFFEAPNSLHQELPELYKSLVKFLGQDPRLVISR